MADRIFADRLLPAVPDPFGSPNNPGFSPGAGQNSTLLDDRRQPDGRRKDYWVFRRRSALNILGDVTIVLSKKRRNDGPKGVKIIVTNLVGASATEILSRYARRWAVELTIKELKAGLHFGQMQVTKDKDRVTRSVALSVLAYLLVLHLYGQETSGKEGWSLFQLKQRFIAEVYQEQGHSSEQRWRKKLDQYRLAS